MTDYIKLKVKHHEDYIESIKKSMRGNIISLILCSALLSVNIMASNNFSSGVMAITVFWQILFIIENYIDLSHEKTMLKYYKEEDFRKTLDFFTASLNRQKENYEALYNSLKDLEAKPEENNQWSL